MPEDSNSQNIKSLDRVDEIQPGDFILVETPQGTKIIDFKDFIINKDNITFAAQLTGFDINISSALTRTDTLTSALFNGNQDLRVHSLSSATGVSATELYINGHRVVAGSPITFYNHISSTGVYFDSGGYNSDQWTGSFLHMQALSSQWSTNFSTTTGNSANWITAHRSVAELSANWQTTYQQTKSLSASWGGGSTKWTQDTGKTYLTVSDSDPTHKVGIGIDNPEDNAATLSVVGYISAADGIKVPAGPDNVDYNSDQWSSVWNVTNSNSAGWGSAAAAGWTDDGGIVRLTTDADQVAIGHTKVESGNKLSVYGTASASEKIYDALGNSRQWGSTFTDVNAKSASWVSVYNNVEVGSANWVDTHQSVNATSGTWNTASTKAEENRIDIEKIAGVSGTWNTAYAQVNQLSADISAVANTSGDWNTASTKSEENRLDIAAITSLTANWHSTYNNVFSNSAAYGFDGAEMVSNSANWTAGYNDKVNSVDFNTSTGSLQLNQQDGGTVTKNLDGRYIAGAGSTGRMLKITAGNRTVGDSEILESSNEWAGAGHTINKVGVGGDPEEVLTVVGHISALGNVYVSGGEALASGVCQDRISNTWETVEANSANWLNTYLHMFSVSGDFGADMSLLASTSSQWDSTFTDLNSLSDMWSVNERDIANMVAVSSTWDRTHQSVNATSGTWDKTHYTVNSISGNWHNTYLHINAVSGEWDINRSDIQTVAEASANWDNTYMHMSDVSSRWEDNRLDIANVAVQSGNWDNTYTHMFVNSGDWQKTKQTVNANSGTWNDSVDGTGTANYIPRYTAARTIADSVIFQDGSNIAVNNTTAAGQVEIKNTTTQDALFIDQNSTGSNYALKIDSEADSPAIYAAGAGVNVVTDKSGTYGLKVERGLNEAGSEPLVNIIDDHTANEQTALRVEQDGTGDLVNLVDGSTEVFTVKDGGVGNEQAYVGVNNPSPESNLHIVGPTAKGTVTDSYGSDKTVIFENTNTTTTDIIVQTTAGNAGSNIINFGSTSNLDASFIKYNQSTDILSIATDGSERVYVDEVGNVGIGVPDPLSKLHVAGDIRMTGSLISDNITTGSTTRWTDTYTIVNDSSADWNATNTQMQDFSALWQSTHTDVNRLSANWEENRPDLNFVVYASGNWQGTFTTVNEISSKWEHNREDIAEIVPLSSKWNSTYTGVRDKSGNWDNTYLHIKEVSGKWEENRLDIAELAAVSSNWNTAYQLLDSGSDVSFGTTMKVDTSNKRVGINETDPDTELHIASTDDKTIVQIENKHASNGDALLHFKNQSPNLYWMIGSDNNDDNKLKFHADGDSANWGDGNAEVTFDKDGFVGIGTEDPTQALHLHDLANIRMHNSYIGGAKGASHPYTPYLHLALNEYYDGTNWQGNGSAGMLQQFVGENIVYFRHDGSGSHHKLGRWQYRTTSDADRGLVVQDVVHTGKLKIGQVDVDGETEPLITAIKDEDTLASNSNTALATQQSIKAYVDSQVTAQDLDVTVGSTNMSIDLDSEALAFAGTANEVVVSGSGNTVTLGLADNVEIEESIHVKTTAIIESSLNASGGTLFANSAKVGVNNTDPKAALHVSNTNSSATYALFTNSTTKHTTSDGFYVGINGSEEGVIWNQEASDIIFATSNLPRMYIDKLGAVGIGESSPQSQLHIHTTGSGQCGILITNVTTKKTSSDGAFIGLDSSEHLIINQQEAANDLKLQIGGSNVYTIDGGTKAHEVTAETVTYRDTANNDFFRIRSGESGNIGIELRSGSTAGTPYIDFSNDASIDYDMRIRLNGNDDLIIEGGGLTVSGTVAATGDISVPSLTLNSKKVTGIKDEDNMSSDSANDLATQQSIKAYVDSSRAFKTISVSGQANVVADAKHDTLTLVAGTNVSIATNATSDTITFTSTDTNTTYSAGDGISLVTGNKFQANLTSNGGIELDGSKKLRIDLSHSSIAGTLGISDGGTGQTSKTNAFDALSPATTSGDIIYHNGTDNVRLPKGSNDKVLQMKSGVPSWETISSGLPASGTLAADRILKATSGGGSVQNSDVWEYTATSGYAIGQPFIGIGATGQTVSGQAWRSNKVNPEHKLHVYGFKTSAVQDDNVIALFESATETSVITFRGSDHNYAYAQSGQGSPEPNNSKAYRNIIGSWKGSLIMGARNDTAFCINGGTGRAVFHAGGEAHLKTTSNWYENMPACAFMIHSEGNSGLLELNAGQGHYNYLHFTDDHDQHPMRITKIGTSPLAINQGSSGWYHTPDISKTSTMREDDKEPRAREWSRQGTNLDLWSMAWKYNYTQQYFARQQGAPQYNVYRHINTYGILTMWGGYVAPSDLKLKKDINVIGKTGLDVVKKLKGVTFEWNDGVRDGKKTSGLIAQEVEKVIPTAVTTDFSPIKAAAELEIRPDLVMDEIYKREDADELIDKYTIKTVDYQELHAYTIEAIKELSNLVDKQQKQIDDLKQQLKNK